MERKVTARIPRVLLGGLALGALLASAVAAEAGTISFAVFENEENGGTSQLDVRLEIAAVGDSASFTISNFSEVPALVTSVWFENDTGGGFHDLLAGFLGQSDASPGVAFTIAALKAKDRPPGARNLEPDWDASAFRFDRADTGGGIGPGDFLKLEFALLENVGLADILTGIDTTNRIGLHVQSIGGDDGFSVSMVTVDETVPPVGAHAPLPPAIWTGLMLLGGLGLLRRRFRRT